MSICRTGEHLIHNLYGKVGGIRMTGSAAWQYAM